MQIAQTELQQVPTIFLGKRLAPSDVISKSLVTNKTSIPILENSLEPVAYLRDEYDEATTPLRKALLIATTSKIINLSSRNSFAYTLILE
jgi:hypothetical protein